MSCRFEVDKVKIEQALQNAGVSNLIALSEGMHGVIQSLQSPNDARVAEAAKKVIDAIEECDKSEGMLTFEAGGIVFQQVWALQGADGTILDIFERRDEAFLQFSNDPTYCTLSRGWRPLEAQEPNEFYLTKEKAKEAKGLI